MESKKPVLNAKAFIFLAAQAGVEIKYNGNTVEIVAGGTSVFMTVQTNRKATMDGLQSNVPYNVSMYSVNAAGNSSPSLTKVVTPQ